MAKVIFCQRVVFAFFGTMTMSAILKRDGHDVEVVLNSDGDEITEEVIRLNPDIVSFSTLIATGEFEWALEIIRKIKKRNPLIITVVGGMQPTLLPEETIKEEAIDIICMGEGDRAFQALANAVHQGKDYSHIENLWVKTPQGINRNPYGKLVADLDEFPFPDRELYQKYHYYDNLDSTDIFAGRGCPYMCSYCYNHVFQDLYRGLGKRVRKHSVEYIIRQIEEVKAKYKPKYLTFQDELFTIDKHWVKEFCEKYPGRVGIPFVCSSRADLITEEMVVQLKTAGCYRVCIGLESGNEWIRKNVLVKPIKDEQFVEAALILHRHGIKILASSMFGIPGETLENAFETISLNQRIKIDYPYPAIFQPYPKLNITKKAEELGFFTPMAPSEYNTTFFKGSFVKDKDIHQIINLQRFAILVIKFPWLTGIVRQLIKLPPNRFYEFIFIASFGWIQLMCFKRNPIQLLAMGLGNLKVFYGKKDKKKAGKKEDKKEEQVASTDFVSGINSDVKETLEVNV